jgi:hypothetical protein
MGWIALGMALRLFRDDEGLRSETRAESQIERFSHKPATNHYASASRKRTPSQTAQKGDYTRHATLQHCGDLPSMKAGERTLGAWPGRGWAWALGSVVCTCREKDYFRCENTQTWETVGTPWWQRRNVEMVIELTNCGRLNVPPCS